MSLAQILEWIRRDAAAGIPMAHRTLAQLTAGGLGTPQSWPAALESLGRAAELGSARAAQELRLLGPDPVPAEFADRLTREALSDAPRVEMIRGFLDPAWCEWIVALSRGRTAPALIYGASGAGERHDRRSNSVWSIPTFDMDVVVHAIRGRIAAAIGVATSQFEPTQILHYAVGQSFADHVDYLAPTHPDAMRSGNRQDTVLIYLNDDFEGGATAFPHLGLRVRGRVGDALWFRNLDAAQIGDPRTLHAGTAPTAGEKWIVSQWVRSRPQPAPR